MRTLYRKHASGIGEWSIWSVGHVIYIAHATVLGGSKVEHTEVVPHGLQSRSLDEQIKSRVASRISKMLDKGYKYTIFEAENSSSNQLGLSRPMLAQPYSKISQVTSFHGAVQQKKLNGHRCLITKQDGKVIAYSRQGKIIPTIPHITEPIDKCISEGDTVDGELYVHGQKLQTIASWVKRIQPGTLKIKFVMYDMISDEPYLSRHDRITSMFNGVTGGSLLILPHEPYKDIESAISRRDQFINAGFEGLMIRLDGVGYEDGKRSSSLIKLKRFDDGEFKVLDIEKSSADWAICVCETSDGHKFKISAPGNIVEKTEVYENRDKYIGRMLTVEYAELTELGIPFHCVATGWREDI